MDENLKEGAALPADDAAEAAPADTAPEAPEAAAEATIIALEKELAEYKDRFIRKMAEFENFKRRTGEEQAALLKYAAEHFIIKLLGVADDFERSLKHIDTATETAAIRDGIHLVYEKMIKLFDEQGVKKIESVGKPFDVGYHEALLQRPAPGVAPHTVLDEVLPGYLYKDKVIRHAQVIVSDDTETPAAGADAPAEAVNG